MEIRLLGPLEVIDEGRPLRLGGRKQRALLAVLALEANRVVARDRLVDALWGEEPPATAQKALQVHVSQLRKLLGHHRVETREPGYLLRADSDELDIARFRHLRDQGQLEQALALWRGPPLADLDDEPFARSELPRLEEDRLACLEERIGRDVAAGRAADVVGELEALVAEHPLRERLRALLMRSLYTSGRQAEALEAYRAARAALVEELGIEPGRELRELHQAMLAQDPQLERRAAVQAPQRPFVGRTAVLAELEADLDAAFAGRGRTILITGEPGIGKSRLVEELIARAQARGALALTGRCWEAGGAPAYWPWVQALRETAEAAEPELATVVGAPPPPPQADPETARFRLYDAVGQFLRRIARAQPLVVFLDDLHVADGGSLLLLQFLERETAGMRALIVGAGRDELAAAEAGTRRVRLAGLTEPEVAELAGTAMTDALWERTGGNPLFVSEVLRLLQADPTATTLPASVRDVIGRRVARLSQECRRVLAVAAVLGREFGVRPLAAATEIAPESLLDLLDEALQARVIAEADSAGRMRFAHVLIRDSLYEMLAPAQRAREHRRALAALERHHGDARGAHLAELAHHAVAGGAYEQAVTYAHDAARWALEQLAYEESARLEQLALQALDAASPADTATRCQLLLGLGDAHARAGNVAVARAAFLEAAELAQEAGFVRELARAAAGYGGRIVWARADDNRLVPLLERALAALGEEDLELRARLLARLAGALRDEPDRDRRDRLSAEAVELARRAGGGVALAYAVDGRSSAIVAPDTISEYLELAVELRTVAEQLGDRERMMQARVNACMALTQLGDAEAAERELRAALALADDLGEPAHLWQVLGIEAMVALACGRFEEAEDLIERASSFGERAQRDAAVAVAALQRFTLDDFRGVPEHGVQAVREVARAHPARPVFRCALAYADARASRAVTLAALASILPFDQEWLFAMSFLAEAAALAGDRDAAAALLPLLEPWQALVAVDQAEGIRGAAARYCGLLAATLGERERAERHLRAAIATNERTGARPWLAHTRADLAILLHDDEARQVAAEEYAVLGMDAWLYRLRW